MNNNLATSLVSLLIDDDDFLKFFARTIKPELFEDNYMVWFADKALKHYREYNTHITLDVLNVLIEGESNPRFNHDVMIEILDDLPTIGAGEKSFYFGSAPEFFKEQACKIAALKAADFLDEKQFDKIPELFEAALKVGRSEPTGVNHPSQEALDGLVRYFSRPPSDFFKTGMQTVDRILGGGLKRGELGTFLGSTGLGKSAILSYLAGYTHETLGRNVAYFTLELNEWEVYARVLASIKNKSLNDIAATPTMVYSFKSNIINELNGNNLSIKQFPTKSTTVRDIDSYLDLLEDNDVMPGMVIIDYADIMSPANYRSDSSYENQGNIYEELRGLAIRRDVAIWTASQANRKSLQEKVVNLDSIGDSFRKAQIADFVIALCQTPDERDANEMRFYMAKIRRGATGWQINLDCDFERMQFHDLGRTDDDNFNTSTPKTRKGVVVD